MNNTILSKHWVKPKDKNPIEPTGSVSQHGDVPLSVLRWLQMEIILRTTTKYWHRKFKKLTKDSMSFCMPSAVPFRLCCTRVMYLLIVVNVDWRMNQRDLFSFLIWRGDIIQLTSMHYFFFVSWNISGCDSRAQSLHPFLSQTPSNQRRDGGLDQNWQGDLFGAILFPGPLLRTCRWGCKFQQKCQISFCIQCRRLLESTATV